MLNDILGISFFLAAVTAMWKAMRYVLDSRRHKQWFYLIGMLGNVSFALALALIIVGSGPDPVWRNETTVILFRLLVFVWAVLGIIFEVMYGRTYIVVRPNGDSGE